MALKSMTGFGRGESSARGWNTEVELSSVNRRQLDVRVNLPRGLAAMESKVYEVIHKALSRGSISGSVRLSAAPDRRGAGVSVDEPLAAACVGELRRVAERLGLDDNLTAEHLLGIPEILRRQAVPEDVEEAWPMVRRALKSALKEMLAMRIKEGDALEKDLRTRLKRLRGLAGQIQKRAPRVSAAYREQLLRRLQALDVPVVLEDPSLQREVAVFADKSDVSEELVRLDSHFVQAVELLDASKPVGRALDFLCQEMFREINTIGSKANDAGIARRVVSFKAELEALREQVQNVE